MQNKNDLNDKLEKLENFINSISIIDHHCHNVLDKLPNVELPLSFILSEGDSINNPLFSTQLKSTLMFKRSIKEIYSFYFNKNYNDEEIDENLGVVPDDFIIENQINLKRNEIGLDNVMRNVFLKSNIESIILDDSLKFVINQIELPIKSNGWHSQYTKVYKVIRLETILEKSLIEAKIQSMTFFAWKSFIEKSIRDPIENGQDNDIRVVGFKSIVAYRCGLSVENPSIHKVLEEYNRILGEIYIDPLPTTSLNNSNSGFGTNINNSRPSLRIENKILIDFFIHIAMGVSASLSKPVPIQIHTGYGDPDLKLELSNPLHLKNLIETYPNVPIVLLHCSYPYTKEAGFLSWVYPNVYIDISLSIPFLSVQGMKNCIESLFELSPIDKIIYASDAHYIPETFLLASTWARKIIFKVLSKSLKNNEITFKESKEFAFKIFKGNVINLYNL